MNFVPSNKDKAARERAATALAELRAWAETADPADVMELDPRLSGLVDGAPVAYPVLKTEYDPDFKAGENYRATLPDLQSQCFQSL